MSNKAELARYFIALVPPEPVFSELNQLKAQISEKYQTKAALQSPPHVTLHMPFRFRESKEVEILNTLDKLNFNKALEMDQNGFGAFPPRVLYVNVNLTEELKIFQKEVGVKVRRHLKVVKEEYRGQAFHPHLTLAFRDLRPIHFVQAWNDYKDKEIYFHWKANSFFLMKHSGLAWCLYKEFNLR